MSDKPVFFKYEDTDRVWWAKFPDEVGTMAFSFDKEHLYYLFKGDYPDKLTAEEKAIFDEENPRWAEFFRDA